MQFLVKLLYRIENFLRKLHKGTLASIIFFITLFIILLVMYFHFDFQLDQLIVIVGVLFSATTLTLRLMEYFYTKPALKVEISDGSFFYSEQPQKVKDGLLYLESEDTRFQAYIDLVITNQSSLPICITSINFRTNDEQKYYFAELYQNRKFHLPCSNVSSDFLISSPTFSQSTYPIKLDAFESIIIGFHVNKWNDILMDNFHICCKLSSTTKLSVKNCEAGIPFFNIHLNSMDNPINTLSINNKDSKQ